MKPDSEYREYARQHAHDAQLTQMSQKMGKKLQQVQPSEAEEGVYAMAKAARDSLRGAGLSQKGSFLLGHLSNRGIP